MGRGFEASRARHIDPTPPRHRGFYWAHRVGPSREIRPRGRYFVKIPCECARGAHTPTQGAQLASDRTRMRWMKGLLRLLAPGAACLLMQFGPGQNAWGQEQPRGQSVADREHPDYDPSGARLGTFTFFPS